MARVTHVKSARQRYAMVPDLDDDGNQKVVPVMKRDGVTPKKTKTGREVTRRLTIQDRSEPLPNLKCDFPGCDLNGEILPGTSYKHITPRSGPYGGTQKNRHSEHPSWNVWEYSYSVGAQVARLQHDMHGEIDAFEFTSTEDFDALKQSLVDQAEDFVGEREETLSNMPEQLQDSSQAQEYVEAAEAWHDTLEEAGAPDESDALADCEECDGTGEVAGNEVYYVVFDATGGDAGPFDTEDETLDALSDDGRGGSVEGRDGDDVECGECDGGKTEDLTDEWVDEAKDALREAVDGCEI